MCVVQPVSLVQQVKKKKKKERNKRIIGKQSGTNNLPSSFAQHLGPDKAQHLKIITGAY